MTVNYLGWLKSDNTTQKVKLYYYTNTKHVLENLEKRRLRISEFSTCNDLFELASFDLRDKSIREKHKAWVKDFGDKVGLICLSENWRSQLMWGHYADKGKGVCLVFEIDRKVLTKVEYLPSREVVSSDYQFPTSVKSSAFKSVCAKKSLDWKYELEHRILIDLKDGNVVSDVTNGSFLHFSDEFKLIGFINGPKPSIGIEEFKKSIGKEFDQMKYFQCRASFRDFTMVVQQKQKMWI